MTSYTTRTSINSVRFEKYGILEIASSQILKQVQDKLLAMTLRYVIPEWLYQVSIYFFSSNNIYYCVTYGAV
jgi:hypothetical protein